MTKMAYYALSAAWMVTRNFAAKGFKMLKGKVRAYDIDAQNGFITGYEGQQYFFKADTHRGHMTRRIPMPGDIVQFDVAQGTGDNPEAVRWTFMSSGIQQGRVKFFNKDKGFGFIYNPVEGQPDIFMVSKDARLITGERPRYRFGDKDYTFKPEREEPVSFTLFTDPGGRLRAEAWGRPIVEQVES